MLFFLSEIVSCVIFIVRYSFNRTQCVNVNVVEKSNNNESTVP